MQTQDVILWHDTLSESTEAQESVQLAAIFDRQRELTELQTSIAEMLYLARAKWIGGTLLPWGLLTAGQRQGYINEVRTLVRKAKGEQ